MLDPEIAAIDAALKAKGFSRADLGRLLGLDSSQVSRVFSGKRKLQLHEARTVNEWLSGGLPLPPAPGATIHALPGMVPLYGWVGASSASKLTVADQNLRGYVPMHPNQAHVRDAFALEVADISMSPRYEPGEIVYIAPNRWPQRGQDCVLVTRDSFGFLKRFVRREPERVILHQLNPERDLEFENDDISAVHTVVGRG